MIREEDLIIIGDEAWTPEEWARRNSRHTNLSPEKRERDRAYTRLYYARNREKLRAYKREWQREYRARLRAVRPLRVVKGAPPQLVGSLHSLACTGPTKATGCRCSKIRCYDKPR